jgi:hypothetical protein
MARLDQAIHSLLWDTLPPLCLRNWQPQGYNRSCMRSPFPLTQLFALWILASVMGSFILAAGSSRAEAIIKQPGNHPHYSVELEPHVILGWASIDTNDPFPRNFDLNHNASFGPGLRVGIPLVTNGFVHSINDSVALGLGIDMAHYGPSSNVVWVPVVMQWNFYVSDAITVFGEPGGALRTAYSHGQTEWHIDGVMQAGAKFMIERHLGLTVRAGYPYFSAGLTFLL